MAHIVYVTGDGDTSKIPDENISSGEISVDLEDITEVSLGEPEPSNEDTANIFDKLAEAGHVGKDTEDSVIGQGNEATSDDQGNETEQRATHLEGSKYSILNWNYSPQSLPKDTGTWQIKQRLVLSLSWYINAYILFSFD